MKYSDALFNSIQDGIVMLDMDLNIISANKAAKKNYPGSFSMEGKKCYELFHHRPRPCFSCPALKCMKTGRVETRQITMPKEAGLKKGAFEILAFPMFDPAGKLAGVVEYFRDITEKKQTENLIRIQRDLAIRLGKTDNLNQAIEVSLSSLLRIDGIDCAGIYMTDPGDGGLRLVRYRNLPAWFAKLGAYYDAASPQTRLVMAGRPVFSSYESLLSSLGMSGKELADKKALGIKALAIIPIFHEKKVMAAMNIASRSSNQFQKFTKYALEAIAGQLGEAFAKIRSSEMLKSSRLNLQALFENLTDFLFVLSEKGNLISFNPAVINRLGYSEKELLEMNVLDLHPPDRREEAGQIVAEMLAGQTEYCPIPLLTKTGDRISVETYVAVGKWNGQSAIFGISRDISERIAAQTARQISEDRLMAAIEAMDEGFALYDDKDRLVMFNAKYSEMCGLSSEVLVPGVSFEEIIRQAVRQSWYEDAVGREEEWVTERLALHRFAVSGFEEKLGDGRWLKIAEKKTPDGSTVGFRMDITAIKKSEEILLKSLHEKEILLKEVHHRVKNNMQIISSLLNLQIRKLEDPVAVKAFEETENRVHAMSLVHEILYRSDTLSEIDFQSYLERLVHHLTDLSAQKIKIEIKAKHIHLKMEQAVTCGLIAAELITNSLKHAFPGKRKGRLRIKSRRFRNNGYQLCISDNGIGFSKPIDWKTSDTLGLRLVRELVQGQLEGEIDLMEGRGVSWTIQWKGKG